MILTLKLNVSIYFNKRIYLFYYSDKLDTSNDTPEILFLINYFDMIF